jgi:hypothetical protein
LVSDWSSDVCSSDLPHAFELFLDAVVGRPDVPLVGAREAAYRSAVMEAMYCAARERTWVKLEG